MIALRTVLLLLLTISLFPAASHGQKGDLPINPDSIYSVISSTSEKLLRGEKVPRELSVAEWRADLDTLAARIQRRIPYSEAAAGPHHLTRRLDSLKRLASEQTRDQRILSVMRVLNLPAAGTGHTWIRSSQRALGWRFLPLELYRFDDGVYVMSASNPDLIGREVLSIGGTPIDSAYAALVPYAMSDNRWSRETHVQERLLSWANPLKAVGVIERIDEVPVRLRTEEGRTEQIRIESMRPDTPDYVRYLISSSTRPDTPPKLRWSVAARQQDYPNNQLYGISYRDSSNVLYFKYDVVADAASLPPSLRSRFDAPPLADAIDSLRALVENRPLEKFVLDMRQNTGGFTSAATPLIEFLGGHPKINKRGTLYTLVGPITNSAAGLAAMKLERRTKTLFAGQPSGFSPNIWGEGSPVLLPNSKIVVVLSFSYYEGGMPGVNASRSYVDPEVRVPYTSDQHFQNVDSTMIAVRQHEPEPIEATTLTAAERARVVGTYRMSPIHRARVESTEDGLRFHMSRGEPEPFLDTELHPRSDARLATNIPDVHLVRRDQTQRLTLAWKDTTYTLTPVAEDVTLPLEHVRAGRLDVGAEGLRAALNAGMPLGTDFVEYPFTDLLGNPLPAWPDSLSREERARRALPYARLATELAPTSWRTHADLAHLHKILVHPEEMREAAQRVVDLDRRRGIAFVRNTLELTVAANGTVQ